MTSAATSDTIAMSAQTFVCSNNDTVTTTGCRDEQARGMATSHTQWVGSFLLLRLLAPSRLAQKMLAPLGAGERGCTKQSALLAPKECGRARASRECTNTSLLATHIFFQQ